MKILLLLGLLMLAGRVAPDAAYPPAGIGQWDRGVVQSNIHDTICTAGYTAIVRSGKGGEFGAVTDAIKSKVYARDRKAKSAGHCCEVDHAFPLELGGANTMGNLWAESWDYPYGARDKDVVETALHRKVCASSGAMPLGDAQKCLESDWVACGRSIGVLKGQ